MVKKVGERTTLGTSLLRRILNELLFLNLTRVYFSDVRCKIFMYLYRYPSSSFYQKIIFLMSDVQYLFMYLYGTPVTMSIGILWTNVSIKVVEDVNIHILLYFQAGDRAVEARLGECRQREHGQNHRGPAAENRTPEIHQWGGWGGPARIIHSCKTLMTKQNQRCQLFSCRTFRPVQRKNSVADEINFVPVIFTFWRKETLLLSVGK